MVDHFRRTEQIERKNRGREGSINCLKVDRWSLEHGTWLFPLKRETERDDVASRQYLDMPHVNDWVGNPSHIHAFSRPTGLNEWFKVDFLFAEWSCSNGTYK